METHDFLVLTSSFVNYVANGKYPDNIITVRAQNWRQAFAVAYAEAVNRFGDFYGIVHWNGVLTTKEEKNVY